MDERITDELESLEAILMDEVTIRKDGVKPIEVEITVFPATANDSSSQYVRITLLVTLSDSYPDSPPTITLKNPRGLDDNLLKVIEERAGQKLKDMVGEPVIFELIECVRELLTDSNLPSGHCVICLYNFTPEDDFVKTSCYHYFHSNCLLRHLDISEKIFKEEQEKLPTWQQTTTFQRLCPVCREVIVVDMNALMNAAPPKDSENARSFELNEDLKKLQKQMAALFQQQQRKGGIIDLEAEESKLLLVTEPQEQVPPAGPSANVPSANVTSHSSRVNISRGGASRGRGAFVASRKNRETSFNPR